jgi:hypothetical protein
MLPRFMRNRSMMRCVTMPHSGRVRMIAVGRVMCAIGGKLTLAKLAEYLVVDAQRSFSVHDNN